MDTFTFWDERIQDMRSVPVEQAPKWAFENDARKRRDYWQQVFDDLCDEVERQTRE